MKSLNMSMTILSIAIILLLGKSQMIVEDCNKLNDSLSIENANLKSDIINIKLYADSIEEVKDSINSELFISNYKLERIKKYNKIAAKGNNIKYLRGWINRVVNE